MIGFGVFGCKAPSPPGGLKNPIHVLSAVLHSQYKGSGEKYKCSLEWFPRAYKGNLGCGFGSRKKINESWPPPFIGVGMMKFRCTIRRCQRVAATTSELRGKPDTENESVEVDSGRNIVFLIL